MTGLCLCPAPSGKEKGTSLHVPLCEKYQVYQSEGGIFRSSSAYEKTLSVLRPFLLKEVNRTEYLQYVSTSCTQLLVLRIRIVRGLTHVRVRRVCSRHIKTYAVQYMFIAHVMSLTVSTIVTWIDMRKQDKEKKLDYVGNVDIMFVAADYTTATSGLAQ